MPKIKLRWVLLAAAIVTAAVWESPIVPKYEPYCKDKDTKHEECATYDVTLVLFWKIGKFLDDHNGTVGALAGIAVAIFTYYLKHSTDKLWIAGEKQQKLAQSAMMAEIESTKTSLALARELADAAKLAAIAQSRSAEMLERTAEKQLRAYVLVAGGTIKFPKPGAPEAHVMFKNFGKTPAYNVRIWIHMWIESHPLRVVLPEPPANFEMATSILPPGGTSEIFMPKEPPVPPQSIQFLGKREGTIYVYGEVLYIDAFEIERTTKYRLIYGGREGARGDRLGADNDGNYAT